MRKFVTLDDNSKPQILIVDDDSFNLFALKSLFQQLGFESEVAINGEEAVELV